MVAVKRDAAASLFHLSLLIAAILSVIIGMLIWAYMGAWWSGLFTLTLIARAAERIFMNWAIRVKAFRAQARALFLHSALRNGEFVALALLGRLDGWNLIYVDLIASISLGALLAYWLPLPAWTAVHGWRQALDQKVRTTAFYNGLSAIAEAVTLHLPTTIVGAYFGLSTAGGYHLATRLCEAGRILIGASISSSAFQSFSQTARAGDRVKLNDLYKQVLSLSLIASIVAFIMLIAAAMLLTHTDLGDKWSSGIEFIYYLAAGYIFIAAAMPLYRVFTVLHAEMQGFFVNLIWAGATALSFLGFALMCGR